MSDYSSIFEKISGCPTFEQIYKILCGYSDNIAAEYFDELGNIKSLTYSEYEIRIKKAAGAVYSALGGETKRFVGLKIKNSPEWPIIFWAILISGNYALLLDAEAKKAAIDGLLFQAGAMAIISDQAQEHEGVINLDSDAVLNSEKQENCAAEFADKIALCTSGTTGAVRVFVYDGSAMAEQLLNARDFFAKSKDLIYESSKGRLKNLAFLPLHHIFGFIAVYMWYSCGGKTIVYLKDRNPETIMKTCKTLKVTHIFSVPLFWNSIASAIRKKIAQQGKRKQKIFNLMANLSTGLQSAMPRFGRKAASVIFNKIQKNIFGSSVRFMISGGGYILPETLKMINTIGYPLYNGFGMTETGITSVELEDDYKTRLKGSVGFAFNSVGYKLKSGELLILGSSLHSGKMADGEFIKRGSEWFRTGDIGRFENGRLYIEGRLKEVIIGEGGENLYPDELESFFSELSEVANYCILGLNGGGSYEDIALALELKKQSGPRSIEETAKQINKINSELPFAKKIRVVLVLEQSIPFVSGKKVQRQKLKSLIENEEIRYSILDLYKKHLSSRQYQEVLNSIENDPHFIELKSGIQDIFASVLMMQKKDIGDFDSFFDDLGGDSLTIIGMLAKIREKYDIVVPIGELASLMSVNINQITELLYQKLYKNKMTETVPAAADDKVH